MSNGSGASRWREAWASQENDRRRRAHEASVAAWRRDNQDLRDRLAAAQTFEGLPPQRIPHWLALRRDEVLLWTGPSVGLVEPMYDPPLHPTTYDRYLPALAGQPAPLRAAPTPGAAAITNRRVVFQGPQQREWFFAKATGITDTADNQTLIRVTNRKKLSGLAIPPATAPVFRFQLALALADFANDRAGLVAYLEGAVVNHQRLSPGPPALATPDQAPLSASPIPVFIGAAAVTLAVLLCVGIGLFAPDTPDTSGLAASPSSAADRSTSVIESPPLSPSPSPTPTSKSPTPPATKSPPSKPPPKPKTTTAKPRRTTTKPVNLCGAPQNPYGYNFCGGSHIYKPKAGVCSYFRCIDYFWNGKGYMIQCNDGMVSMSGGRQGSCSHHGGNRRAVFQ